MRTKHILTALVLPAMFAACTADDIEGLNNSLQQPERAVLSEDFKLGFDGVESRLSAGDPDGAFDFQFENNDTVGGAIVDAYNADGDLEVVNYVSTNHPFVKEGKNWKINHTMVEGSYLFYYPYNQNNNSRSAVVYEIPVMQDLSDADGTFNRKAAIEKYSTAIGLAKLDKDDLSAYPTIRPINSYVRVVAKFDNRYAGGEVDKVVLSTDATESFVVKGQISNVKLNTIEEAVLAGTKEWADVKAVSEVLIASDEPFYNKPAEITGRTSKVLVGKVPAGVKMKVDAQNNKSFETYMVVPAQSLTKAMSVYLYLTDGRVFKGNTSSTGITFNRHTPKKVEVNMDETEEVPFVITSMDDWNLYASQISKNTTAAFEIANPEFVLTNEAKYPTAAGATIKVTTDLTIAGDNVTMKNVVAEGKLIVAEGAKLTTDETLVAGEIENYGEVVVAPVKDEDGDYIEYNLGGYSYTTSRSETVTLTVSKSNLPKGEEATLLDATITNMPGATLEIAENAIVRTAIVNKINTKVEEMPYGNVTVNGTVKLISGSTNAGKVTNNGSMTGAFVNEATKKYDKNAVDFDDVADYIYFRPSIANSGEIFATAAWTNNGKIVNAKGAEISVSKVDDNAAFTNNGSIDLKDGSFCLISTNSATGEIVLSVLNQENWSANTNSGVVAYTTSTTDAGKTYDFTTTGKNITKIYLNGSLGITKVGKVNNIVVAKDATITMPAEGTIANLTVNEGVAAAVKSATVNNVIKTANFTNVTVKKGATLTINEGHALTCAEVRNAGTIYVGGSFSATETLQAEAGNGKFKTTSTTGNISFGGQTDAQKKKEAYEDALEIYVKTWIDESNVPTWEAATAGLKTTFIDIHAVRVAGNSMVDAYNAWKGTSKVYTGVDIIAVANYDESSYLEDAIEAVKTAAATSVKEVVLNKTTETDASGEKVFANWKNSTDGYYLLKNKYGVDSSLKNMWSAYKTWLTNNIMNWTVEDGNGNDTYPYKNTGSKTINTYVLAINDIIDAANLDHTYVDENGVIQTTTPGTPDLAIPANTYIDASNEEGAAYVVVKAWVKFTATAAPSDASAADPQKELRKYCYGSTNATNNALYCIANWCYELNRMKEENLNLEQSKAKKAIADFVDTVTEDWGAENGQSSVNIKALAVALNQ